MRALARPLVRTSEEKESYPPNHARGDSLRQECLLQAHPLLLSRQQAAAGPVGRADRSESCNTVSVPAPPPLSPEVTTAAAVTEY